MTDVVTATVPVADVSFWDIPPGEQVGLQPRGEVVFAGSQTIAALGTGDEGNWTLQMNLPRNYHYRFVEANVTVSTVNAADLVEWQAAMRVLVSSDAPGFVQWNFPMAAIEFPNDTTSYPIQAVTEFTAAGNSVLSYWKPQMEYGSFIDAANGAGRLLLSWFNISASATNATTTFFRFRALIYDQDQVLKYPVHSPVPTIGP